MGKLSFYFNSCGMPPVSGRIHEVYQWFEDDNSWMEWMNIDYNYMFWKKGTSQRKLGCKEKYITLSYLTWSKKCI